MELLKKTPKNLENAKQISQSTEIAQQAQLLREYCHVHASNKKVFSRVELAKLSVVLLWEVKEELVI